MREQTLRIADKATSVIVMTTTTTALIAHAINGPLLTVLAIMIPAMVWGFFAYDILAARQDRNAEVPTEVAPG